MAHCEGNIFADEHFVPRQRYSHEQYMRFITDLGHPAHDYESQSTGEDPRMIAFFDSLIQRTNQSIFDSSDEEDARSPLSNILDILVEAQNSENEADTHSNDDDDSRAQSNHDTSADAESTQAFGVSIAELRRIFRCDQRQSPRPYPFPNSESEADIAPVSVTSRIDSDSSSSFPYISSSRQSRTLTENGLSNSHPVSACTCIIPTMLPSSETSSDVHSSLCTCEPRSSYAGSNVTVSLDPTRTSIKFPPFPTHPTPRGRTDIFDTGQPSSSSSVDHLGRTISDSMTNNDDLRNGSSSVGYFERKADTLHSLDDDAENEAGRGSFHRSTDKHKKRKYRSRKPEEDQ